MTNWQIIKILVCSAIKVGGYSADAAQYFIIPGSRLHFIEPIRNLVTGSGARSPFLGLVRQWAVFSIS